MIIKRLWTTDDGYPKAKYGMRRIVRKWRGYFLFGFIPLYIACDEALYRNE